MISHGLEISPRSNARNAGLLYLIIAVCGGFSMGYVPSVIVVAGDAATTAAHLLANQRLFGIGVFADVIVMLTEVVLTVMLFVMFKPVSPTLSLIAMVSRLTMVVVMAVNLLVHIMPLVLLRGADHLHAFAPEQLRAMALVLIEAHQYGIYVWDIFFGVHLGLLGYLIYKSGCFPRILGASMSIGSLGYFLEDLVKVTFVHNGALAKFVIALLVVATISELSFAFWLLIKGANDAASGKQAAMLATA